VLTLYLLRHAKSSWKDQTQSDFDRPLNKRGNKDAVDLGRHLQNTGIHPDLILLSPAKRTHETFQLLAEQLSPRPDVVNLKKLYEARMADIVREIQQQAGAVARLMVIAHNPGIESLAWHLTGDDPSNALAILQLKYPTSGMTTLTFDIAKWADITPNSGTLVNFTSPRMRPNI